MKILFLLSLSIFSNLSFAQRQPLEECVNPAYCTEENKCLTGLYSDSRPDRTMCCAGLVIVGNGCFDTSTSGTSTSGTSTSGTSTSDTSQPNPIALCESDDTCSPGLGCLEAKPEDFYANATDDIRNQLARERAEYPSPVENGANCQVNANCLSRNCMTYSNSDPKRTCQLSKICRKAKVYERAASQAICSADLIFNNGICNPPPLTESLSAANLAENKMFDIEISENGCKHNVAQETIDKMKINIKALRALEFLFANNEFDYDNKDRYDFTRLVSGYMTPQVGRKIGDQRKKLVQDFSEKYMSIAADYNTVANATKGSKAIVTYDGKPIISDFLAQRHATGIDALLLMKRTNQTYQNYEIGMHQILTDTFSKITKFREWMATTKEDASHWEIDGIQKTVKAPQNPKYLGARSLLDGEVIYTGSLIRLRASAATRYTVLWRAKNLDVLFKHNDFLKNYLSTIKDRNPIDEYPDQGLQVSHFLLDPLMPAGTYSDTAFTNHGEGICCGVDELWRRTLNNKVLEKDNLAGIRDTLKKGLIAHYKSMSKNSSGTANFIFEPELLSNLGNEHAKEGQHTSSCLDSAQQNLNNVSEACKDTWTFIDQETDITFSQFWAWSAHKNDNYYEYWGVHRPWRRYLVEYYEVLYLNLLRYYYSMAVAKEIKKECLQKAIDNIEFNYSPDGSREAGIQVADKTDYYDGGSDYTSSGKKETKRTRTTTKRDGKIFLDPSTFSSKDFTNVNRGSIGSSLGASAGSSNSLGGGLSSAMRDRIKAIETAKSKLSAAELDKNKKALASLMSTNKKSGSGNTTSGSSSGNTNNFFGNQNNGRAMLAPEEKTKKEEGLGAPVQTDPNKQASPASPASSGSLMSFSSDRPLDKSLSEATGMSDQESDVVMRNLDKDKNHYESKEEDGLFDVVSKTYMRNLNRFLTPKKQIKE